MNQYDTQLVKGILTEDGWLMAATQDEADVVLINTCSVRSHAEQRALGRIGFLAGWKRQSAERKIGVIGCMAQRMGGELLKSKPWVDFVIGPDGYRNLPELIGRPEKVVRADFDPEETYQGLFPNRDSSVTSPVAIMRGCDNACSYCIVPKTRGRERSRSLSGILDEIEDMVQTGVREAVLLGQNVNSYRSGAHDFPDLLRAVSRIDGLLRVRFMTSHPKDLSDKLIEVMASEIKVCPHIHLPVQSGSDRILELMNRGYTAKTYLGLIDKARQAIPGLGLSTDIMVGFPGETEAEFRETYDLVESVRFDDAYTYHFSPREGTAAFDMRGQIQDDEKLDRLDRLIKLQRGIALENKRALVGSTVEVLPEGPSRQTDDEWMGRTPSNHLVVFPRNGAPTGEPVSVTISSCRGATLRGSLKQTAIRPRSHKDSKN
jgi:tRNA-2-methylthio-N6-dimethylallyladenosine synthase